MDPVWYGMVWWVKVGVHHRGFSAVILDSDYGGTCAMLPEEKGGVVDPSLRVYGVPNVRVVDSSAVPLISNANMQSVVYAFAERAADLIKATYGLM